MKPTKSEHQIQRPHYLTSPTIGVKRKAALAVMLLWLASWPAMPGHCWNPQPSSQSAIMPASHSAWSITGNLNGARYGHTATLLPNGNVLVVGGHPNGSAELYNPSTEMWSYTGSLNIPRYGHTATLLRNGKVLVAGGMSGLGPLDSAEIYDPAAGTWSSTANLKTVHYWHTATLLQNGKVLVVGGLGQPGWVPLNTAEVYDPTTEMWSATGSIKSARCSHTATLLENGRVLIVGGTDDPEWASLASAQSELYDPATGSWSPTENLKQLPFSHSSTLLPDGKVIVAGVWGWIGGPASLSELYDPASGTWSSTHNLNAARYDSSTTQLSSGAVLVAGGWNEDRVESSKSAELYQPTIGVWHSTANLNTPRHSHTATLLTNGKVLVAGGVSHKRRQNIILNSAELYHPATTTAIPRIVSVSVQRKYLLVFGENFYPDAVILLNGEEQKTRHESENPEPRLVGKKVGKKIKPGDRLQVRNPNGSLSEEFTFSE